MSARGKPGGCRVGGISAFFAASLAFSSGALQDPLASFASPPLWLEDPANLRLPVALAVADLDKDGDLDVASANSGFYGSDNLTVFFQVAPRTFVSPARVLVASDPRALAAADLDGDGDQDLVSANAGSDSLAVFFQISGVLSTHPVVVGGAATTNDTCSVLAADLDADGDRELVSCNLGSDDLSIFFQVSPGSFAPSPLALGGAGVLYDPCSVVAADLDGDGDRDLASAERAYRLSVFFQLSPGVFAPAPLRVSSSGYDPKGPRCVAAADVDGDGDVDLVSANYSGQNLTVFTQVSAGVFTSTPLVLGGSMLTRNPVWVSAADLDGDQDVDLVSANLFGYGMDLSVFPQLAPGVFAARPIRLGSRPVHKGGNGTCAVLAADLDRDGSVDLVSANQFLDNLRIDWGER